VLGKQALDLKKMFAVGEIPDLNGSKFSNWWFQPTPLKNDGVRPYIPFPTEWKVIKQMFQTTNQF